ncbi:MAG: HAD family hydrolase [Burkholderiaceae bacterium]
MSLAPARSSNEPRLAPLSDFVPGPIDGLFCDIDDTLTRDGRLHATTLAALERLANAGIRIVPVTGRSAGWAHMILRQWPVDAVIAESGGLYGWRDQRGALQWTLHDAPERVRAARERLAEVAERLMRELPGFALADDNAFRLVDFAIDYCEAVEPVPAERVEALIAGLRAAGFSARASTVHVNAWAGSFDKGPMALRYLRERAAGAPTAHWVCVGDAPNDQSMFAAFEHSVGVANILRFRDRLEQPPRWVTRAACDAGFVELAEHLIARRGRG